MCFVGVSLCNDLANIMQNILYMQEKNKNITDISVRIKEVIDYLSITPNRFSKSLGYERTQTIYDILNSKSAPSFDFFNRLYNSEYSELINPIWLLTGKGLMTDKLKHCLTENLSPQCHLCKAKEQTIIALKESNNSLKELILLYKQSCKTNTRESFKQTGSE